MSEHIIETEISNGALFIPYQSKLSEAVREEIVRCGDCRHATISTTGVCKYCEMFVLPDVDGYGADSQVNLPLDFFCGFAERKEVNSDD